MEVIRKKICLESSRSRKQGLLPFIRYNTHNSLTPERMRGCEYVDDENVDGNWGCFVINPGKRGEDGRYVFENYAYISHKYNEMLDIIRNGIRLKAVRKFVNGNSGETEICYTKYLDNELDVYDYYPINLDWLTSTNDILYRKVNTGITIPEDVQYFVAFEGESYDTFISYEDESYSKCKKMDMYVGRLHVPKDIIGPKVPEFINYCDVREKYNWMNENKDVKDCCRKKEWNDKGGQKMLDFLESSLLYYENVLGNISDYLIIDDNGNVCDDCIPKINLNILITGNYEPIGIGIPYIDEETELYEGLDPEYIVDITDYTAESQLFQLRDDEIYMDDDETVLPGIFVKFDKTDEEGNECDYGTAVYNRTTQEWEITEHSVLPDSYNMTDILSSIPSDADKNTTYFVRYDNSSTSPMRIPYTELSPKNISMDRDENGEYIIVDGKYQCTCNIITNIEYGSDTIEFTYVIGAICLLEKDDDGYSFSEYIENTGIVYNEEYAYLGVSSDTFTINGTDTVIYYEDIDYSSNSKILVSKDFGATREGYMSNIVAMPLHDGLTVGNFTDCVEAPFVMPDYMMGITESITAKADVIMSRGNASAFEKHLKLSECNTLDDLVNYGNNYFNL